MADEKQTGRVEAFSDGVFAIAITLLILDLKVPPVEEFGNGGLGVALARSWPSYFAFFMSFVVVLVMWVNHHRIFTVVRKVDDAFMYWNGLLLFFVTVVPFPTSLLAEYLLTPQAKVAAGLYAFVGFLISLAFTAVWQRATRHARLVQPGAEREVAELSRRYRYGPLAYLIAFLLVFVSAWATVALCFAMVMFFAVRGLRGLR